MGGSYLVFRGVKVGFAILAVDRAVVGASAEVGRLKVGGAEGVPYRWPENFFRVHVVHINGNP